MRLSDEEVAVTLKAAKLKALEPYVNASTPLLCRCLHCKLLGTPTLRSLRAGQGRSLNGGPCQHGRGWATDEDTVAAGDHITVPRIAYRHHGLAVGPEKVIDFSADKKWRKKDARVRYRAMSEFRFGKRLTIVARPADPAVVLRRARSERGQGGYKLFSNNCEYKTTRWFTGEGYSDQVKAVKRRLIRAAVHAAVRAAVTGFPA
jgi:hypothetical protein